MSSIATGATEPTDREPGSGSTAASGPRPGAGSASDTVAGAEAGAGRPPEQTGDDGLLPGPAPLTASHPRIAALEEPVASLAEAQAACGGHPEARGGARRRVQASGRVAEIRVAAATERPSCEALLLVDGPRDRGGRATAVRLVWQGQRSVPGVRAGTELSCSGLLCSSAGQSTIYNPRFEIIARETTS